MMHFYSPIRYLAATQVARCTTFGRQCCHTERRYAVLHIFHLRLNQVGGVQNSTPDVCT